MKRDRLLSVASLFWVTVAYIVMKIQMKDYIIDYLKKAYRDNTSILQLYMYMSVGLFIIFVLSVIFWSRKKEKMIFHLLQGLSFVGIVIVNFGGSYFKQLFSVIYRAGLLIFFEGTGNSFFAIILDIGIWLVLLTGSLILTFLIFCGIGNVIFIMAKQGIFR